MGMLAACGGGVGRDGDQRSPILSNQAQQFHRTAKTLSSVYQTEVQQLYIAYFGRPADPTGLFNLEAALSAAKAPNDIQGLAQAYTANSTIAKLVDQFGTSNESVMLYGGSNVTDFVTAIFHNVFGRAPQSAGLNFWVGAITSGSLTRGDAALSIIAGAFANTSIQGQQDAALIANRIAAANYFTSQLTKLNAVSVYSGQAAAGISRSMLSSVNAATDAANFQSAADAAISSLQSLASGGANYYVSPSGLDGNSGTLAAPWKTIQHAVSMAGPGTTINVHAGIYAEQVVFSTSGNASGGYITLQSYANEAAIIDGTGIGTAVSHNALVNLNDVSYVKVIGFEIRNFTSDAADFVPAGIFVSGSGSNIELRNNYVHDITTTVNDSSGNAFGIAIYGNEAPASINGLIIDGNEVAHLKTGSSESLTLNGNVEKFQVTNNKVHDDNNIGIDMIGFEGTSPDPAYDQARNGLVSGNLVYNITSYGNPAYGNNYGADGLYVDGGTNIVIERNIVHHTDIGAELASEHFGHVASLITLRSNLIYSNNLIGISLGGANASNGGVQNCGVYNNTLYQNDTLLSGSGEIGLQNNVSSIQFANNLVFGNSQGLFLSTQTEAMATVINGDLYYAPVGTQPSWNWNGSNYNTFAGYQAGSGNDQNGRYANPLLIDPSKGNFIPAAGSVVINSGIAITATQAGMFDLAGNARLQGASIDAGAYEQ
jgi:hypothetical protein